MLLENQISVVLYDMERTGVSFDVAKMEDIRTRIRADISALESEIFEIIGERININSPKQLQVLFFQKLGIKPIKKRNRKNPRCSAPNSRISPTFQTFFNIC